MALRRSSVLYKTLRRGRHFVLRGIPDSAPVPFRAREARAFRMADFDFLVISAVLTVHENAVQIYVQEIQSDFPLRQILLFCSSRRDFRQNQEGAREHEQGQRQTEDQGRNSRRGQYRRKSLRRACQQYRIALRSCAVYRHQLREDRKIHRRAACYQRIGSHSFYAFGI